MTERYILKDRKAVATPDLMEWAKWYETADRRVARTEINDDVYVSTVFLALDHSSDVGPPLLFETMVFGGPLHEEQDRYTTWEQAEQGHKRMVEQANGRET